MVKTPSSLLIESERVVVVVWEGRREAHGGFARAGGRRILQDLRRVQGSPPAGDSRRQLAHAKFLGPRPSRAAKELQRGAAPPPSACAAAMPTVLALRLDIGL